MKFSLSILLAIAQAVIAAPVSQTGSYQLLSFNITRGSNFADSNNEKPHVVRSTAPDGSILSKITNEQSFYSIDVEFGSTLEKATVLLDTGSSDLWVSGANNPYCLAGTAKVKREAGVPSADQFDCSTFGTFDTTKSKTWHSNNTEFYITYGDYTYAKGTWGYDNVDIGGIKINDFSFAVASESNSTVAVLGIGLEQLEASDEQTGDVAPFTYANLPTRLLQDGLTESRAYSLQLTPGSQGSESGSILFGAVDHDKYSGSLQYVPMVNVYANQGFRNPIEFDVTLSSIKTGDTTITNTLYPALLDSGTTLVYAPGDVADAFGQALGGSYSDYLGLYTVPCSAGSGVSVTFNFQGIDISVPASEFILSTDETGTNNCAVGILDSGDDHFILGDTFLRSAYVVYDLENYEIALGQSKVSNSQDIEVIGSSGIPGATRAPLYNRQWTGR